MIDVTRPLPQNEARKLAAKIAREGSVVPSTHAKQEMASDPLGPIALNDIMNVLRMGRLFEPCEMSNGTWRYRIHTDRFCVVVAIRSEDSLVVVTTWRKKS